MQFKYVVLVDGNLHRRQVDTRVVALTYEVREVGREVLWLCQCCSLRYCVWHYHHYLFGELEIFGSYWGMLRRSPEPVFVCSCRLVTTITLWLSFLRLRQSLFLIHSLYSFLWEYFSDDVLRWLHAAIAYDSGSTSESEETALPRTLALLDPMSTSL